MWRTQADVEHIDHIYHIDLIEKICRTHRYDHISLLRFRPGEVLQELVARRRRKDKLFFKISLYCFKIFSRSRMSCLPSRENLAVTSLSFWLSIRKEKLSAITSSGWMMYWVLSLI